MTGADVTGTAGAEPFSHGSFAWALGIEDTCVYPPARFAMAPLDEHRLTGHDDAWRADLDTVRHLGATALRYGVDWPRVHLGPGRFDWSVLDERLPHAAADGVTVIADLVHYGTPTWLDDSFADPRYPDAIAEFAGAFAERYAGVVDHVTPLNEPITTASFAGLRGVWPPGLSGWDGWTCVVLGIVAGIQRTVRAVRAANPRAVIVHVEASTLVEPTGDAAEVVVEAALLDLLGSVPTDLVLGRVTAEHPAHAWLVDQGATPAALRDLVDGAVTIDLLGVNYYPDLSPRRLVLEGDRVVQHAHDRWTDGLADSLRRFERRYGLPMLVTETSIEGDDDVRSAWVQDAAETVQALAADGVDVRGFTWWPLFDFVDWSYAAGGRNVEEFELPPDVVARRASSTRKAPYLRRMGLVHLEERHDGALERIPTAAAAVFAERATASMRTQRPPLPRT
ncbi:family 1 glycosylhydrolase [Curtobacterium sp. RHCJP20]|uniref:Family 1 glycosylhydrolase n=1 Tax=Curtobacterium subtropicum TaxID=3055138 RepID=A0ABT7TBB0_9MICO|nr:family 1 glycosylhydrolase [Curtobacterium subtropicum]MDM7886845.1 family 1 glycosylhydrolase [Curtobacterium subtropicum]